MVKREVDKDVIEINLEEIFGEVIYLTAHDAEKTIPEANPLLLVMTQNDVPIFLKHLDTVVSEMTPHLLERMTGQGITVTDLLFTAEFVKDEISKEGLEITDKAIHRAMVSGILAKYQYGAPGYEPMHLSNKEDYKEALNQLANAVFYRVSPSDRRKIIQRHF